MVLSLTYQNHILEQTQLPSLRWDFAVVCDSKHIGGNKEKIPVPG